MIELYLFSFFRLDPIVRCAQGVGAHVVKLPWTLVACSQLFVQVDIGAQRACGHGVGSKRAVAVKLRNDRLHFRIQFPVNLDI